MSYDLEAFFRHSLDLFCIAGWDGYFRRVNPAFRRTLGWSEEELLEAPFLDFVHENDKEATIREMEKLSRGEGTVSFANRYRCKDGSYRFLEWRSYPDVGGEVIHAAARDITDQIEEETERHLLSTAVEQCRSAIAMVDLDARVTYANPSFLWLTGVEVDGQGDHVTNVLSDLELPGGLIDDLETPGVAVTWASELPMKRAHREDLWLRVSLTPVQTEDDSFVGHLLIMDDVTDQRHAHEALMRTAMAKDDFLASMSHELRTPLNAVITITESLEEGVYGELSPGQLDALTIVEESGRHLLSLINDILDLSKIEAGRMGLDRAAVETEQLCRGSLRLVQDGARKKNHDLHLSIDDRVAAVEGDARRLKQILVNLLGNAVKFTPEGGRIRLDVVGDPEHGTVSFSVRDNGIGLDPDDMERLFQPFVQSGDDASREGGTGLGLSLALRLTEMHGGSLAVDSDGRGKGSRFTVTIPWNPAVVHGTAEPGPGRVGIRSALLVEDSAVTSDHLVRYLKELGVEASVNRRGDRVVEEAQELRPDVILLDLLLPRASGWDILTELKQDAATRSIPVVVTSVVDDRARGRMDGAAAYLVKPISRSELAGALRLSERERARASAEAESGLRPTETPGRPRPLILLAEDNEMNVRALRPFLESKGYDVALAANGKEAVRCAHDLNPALILMDVQMPELDGLEATRQIRALESPDEPTPIVALTALAMPGDRERCLAAGADEYLSKPVSLKRLSGIMEELTNGGGDDGAQ